MKKLRLLFISFIMFFFCASFDGHKSAVGFVTSSIEWEKSEYDFGKIRQNIPVTAVFEFKNPSMVPLVILSVKPDCGCTVADYPKEPIKSGKSGKVSVDFDAKIPGFFQKSITVQSNTEEGSTVLVIKGEVVGRSIKPKTD